MKTMYHVNDVITMIKDGKTLLLAGDETLLKSLPKGNWIAGTIPYFMSDKGGLVTKELVYVEELPEFNTIKTIETYSASELHKIPEGYSENGISYIILPTFTEVHSTYAEKIFTIDDIFNSPLVGWVSGVHLDELGTIIPKVFNGLTGQFFDDKCVVMHTDLPEDYYAEVETINIFEPSSILSKISFFEAGSSVKKCLIDGKEAYLTDYIKNNDIDSQLPIMGDFMGAMLNVGFKNIDYDNKIVEFYSPVFPEVEYSFSAPIGKYPEAFGEKLAEYNNEKPIFACNCLSNFLYGELEGKFTGKITGPITFGEVAYMLLNQTMVLVNYRQNN